MGPAETLLAVYKEVEQQNNSSQIVHPIQVLKEELGDPYIAIIKDLDGFEICLVSSETFDPAVLSAADWVGPDWSLRAGYLKAALDKKKAEEFEANKPPFSIPVL